MNYLLNSLIQAAVFAAVPFLWWLFSVRLKKSPQLNPKPSFLRWTGLRRPRIDRPFKLFLLFALTVLLFAGLTLLTPLLLWVDPSMTANAQFAGGGLKVLPRLLVFSFVQTGLSEEILFRGFLGKRLADRLGFAAGNALQALVFGLIHGILFLLLAGPVISFLLILVTGGIGWLMGYIDEKGAGGSILPSIILHGLANTLSALPGMF